MNGLNFVLKISKSKAGITRLVYLDSRCTLCYSPHKLAFCLSRINQSWERNDNLRLQLNKRGYSFDLGHIHRETRLVNTNTDTPFPQFTNILKRQIFVKYTSRVKATLRCWQCAAFKYQITGYIDNTKHGTYCAITMNLLSNSPSSFDVCFDTRR